MKIYIIEKSEGNGYFIYKAFLDLQNALDFVRKIRRRYKDKVKQLAEREWQFTDEQKGDYFYLRIKEEEVE